MLTTNFFLHASPVPNMGSNAAVVRWHIWISLEAMRDALERLHCSSIITSPVHHKAMGLCRLDLVIFRLLESFTADMYSPLLCAQLRNEICISRRLINQNLTNRCFDSDWRSFIGERWRASRSRWSPCTHLE